MNDSTRIGSFTTDNRDPLTTWIWVGEGAQQRYVEVFPWELVENAIENVHSGLTEEHRKEVNNIAGHFEDDLMDALDGRISQLMEKFYPQELAELKAANEEAIDAPGDAYDAWNECTWMILGSACFHLARMSFDRAYRDRYI